MRRFTGIALALAFAGCLGVAAAEAHWLSELGEIAATAGRTGGKLAGEVSVGLESAVKIIGKLPAELQKGAIAAEALEDGAWRFRNAAGDTITATSPEGIRSALTGLATDSKSATFYVGETTAFNGRDALAALPSDAKVHLAVDDASFALLRQKVGGETHLYAELNDGVIVALKDRGLFDEALWQLQRPLGKSGIRVMSLDAGGPKVLGSAGKRSPEGLPLAEAIDPAAMNTALPSISGQTIIVTGKIEGDSLLFAGVSGLAGSVPVADLLQAAERSDVNILLLDSGAAKQPGGTTWLWRERGIAHLETAMAQASLGDFISALSHGQGRLAVDADWGASGHFRLSAKPAAADAPAASGEHAGKSAGEHAVEFAVDLAQQLGGNVAPQATSASLNSRDTQWDLDNRLIPGIPAGLQYVIAFSWVFGLIAFYETRRWWAFLQRKAAGIVPPLSWPKRIGSELFYWLIFMPLIGWLTFDVMIIKMFFEQVMGFVRLILRPFRRRKAAA